MNRAMLRSAGEALYFSDAPELVRRMLGVGAILTFHRVRPAPPSSFEPNKVLDVSPQFLETIIRRLQRFDLDFVSLDEMHRRLSECDFRRQFIVVTFDDGYRDNKVWAYPILKKHGIPFAIYVSSSFARGTGDLWWVTLEKVIGQTDEIALESIGGHARIRCRSIEEKYRAFQTLYWLLRTMPTEVKMLECLGTLARRYGVDPSIICADLCMSWHELAELAADPLLTIGAHTVNHAVLARASEKAVYAEMKDCRTELAAVLGQEPNHLAYPFGDETAVGPREFAVAADLGFRTAVSTRRGVLRRMHSDRLTALPRVSVSDECQRSFGVDVLVSGARSAISRALHSRLF